MEFTVIDRDTWEREAYFAHYLSAVPCTYSMTTKLDITPIREKGYQLYPTMLYVLTKTVNQYEEFRMAFLPDGRLVRYHRMSPCYTVFHKETETFSNIWTAFSDEYAAFCRSYAEDIRRYGAVQAFDAKPDMPPNCFTVSMIPWVGFESFHLQTADFRYLIPIFTMGRFENVQGRYMLPLAIQVHHAVCDGFHVARFVNTLKERILAL